MPTTFPRGEGSHKDEAHRLKERYRWLNSFSDDELRDITSTKLEEGDKQGSEMYFDLSHPERGHFKGQPGQPVPEGSYYVARSEVNEKLWNKLVMSVRGH